MLSPTAASVSFSPRRTLLATEDLWGCGADSVSFELLHEHHVVAIVKHYAKDYCEPGLFRLHVRGLIIPIDNGPVLSFLALFLEPKVGVFL